MMATVDKSRIYVDPIQGAFVRTGARRIPVKGEYYLCERIPGVARATGITQGEGWLREIVEPWNEDTRRILALNATK